MMKPLSPTHPVFGAGLGLALAVSLSAHAFAGPQAQERTWEQNVVRGPGPVEADIFHPERETAVEPVFGGSVNVHLPSLPKNLNYMIENSAVTRRIQREVHEYLLEQGWESWGPEPRLARALPVVEDTLILKGGRSTDGGNIVYGQVVEDGDAYVVTPLSKAHALSEPRRVPKSEVESLQLGTVFTFELQPEIQWHDGHVLDAEDVAFAFHAFLNPTVDCDSVRFKYEKFSSVEVLDELSLRFFYSEQYFLAMDAFYDMVVLPSHIYNLLDPDCPQHDPNATPEQVGDFLNEHEANRMWVGLGPYRVTSFGDEGVRATKFADYHVTDQKGHVDEIFWRHVSSDDSAKTALINGELDFWDRLRSEDYFGEYSKNAAFVKDYYKGYVSYPYMGYTTWNMRKPYLSDPNVRRALNMCYDWDKAIDEVYYGLASRITGSPYYFGKNYDRTIVPVPFDLDAAEDLLLEAGWYDRDGDDIVDKDGQPLVIEFLMPTGNKASEVFVTQFQENLAKIGVKLTIAQREWAQFLERLYDRTYDCGNLAWIQDLESDPEQLWHSKWADTPQSSNHCGLADEEVDRLIGEIQRELDPEKRRELSSLLQRRIYELQPYVFGVTQPKKLAVSKRIRNLKAYGPDPSYRIREWFLVDGDARASGQSGQ